MSAKQVFSLKPRLCRFDFRRCFHSGICSRINSSGNITLCFRYRGGNFHTLRKVTFDVSRFIFTHFASVFLKYILVLGCKGGV